LTQDKYAAWSRIAALLLKFIGIAGIVFMTVYWAFTGKFEFSFLPFFGTLAGVGQGLDIISDYSKRTQRRASEPRELKN
jgi:hypothetical protein